MDSQNIYDPLMDPEYEWLLHTCINAFNVCLTMFHMTLFDNITNPRAQNRSVAEMISYPIFMITLDLLMYATL